MALALHSRTPYMRPQRILGSVTRQKVCQPVAPSDSAVSSSSLPCACITGMSSRAMNGKVTNMVASTMPGTANTTRMWWTRRYPPNQPCEPNSRMKMSPAMTGDTAKGRSMSVINALLPRNSNLAIAHAAATPNTRLKGTATAATRSVSLTADHAIGSEIAVTYAPTPLASAWANTASSGSNRNNPRNSSATPIKMKRPHRGRRWESRASAAAMSRQRPVLQCVDAEHERKRQDQHDHRDGRRAGIIELFQFGHDQQRRNFRFHRHISRDEYHRAVFADGAREGERESGEQGRPQRRQHDAHEGLRRRGAECRRGLLDFPVEILENRLPSPHHERQSDERQRHDDSQRGERNFDAEGQQPHSQPAVLCVERGQCNARDGRRQRKRQINHGVDQPLERK